VTLSLYTLFQIQGALSKNLATLLSCRLITGIAGASRTFLSHCLLIYLVLVLFIALTNSGGAVSDIWNYRERGLASAIYATVPFLGPGTYSLDYFDPRFNTTPISHWTHCGRLRSGKFPTRMALQFLAYVDFIFPYTGCRVFLHS